MNNVRLECANGDVRARMDGVDRICVMDIRDSVEPFVVVALRSGKGHELKGYLSPSVAKQLWRELGRLFEPAEQVEQLKRLKEQSRVPTE